MLLSVALPADTQAVAVHASGGEGSGSDETTSPVATARKSTRFANPATSHVSPATAAVTGGVPAYSRVHDRIIGRPRGVTRAGAASVNPAARVAIATNTAARVMWAK